MKKTISILVILFTALGLYVFHIFSSTGYFREVLPYTGSAITQKIMLAGVEDMAYDKYGQFLILSADDRAARRDGNPQQGHLYYLDLKDSVLQPIQLTTKLNFPFYPHGISLRQLTDSIYRVWAINHVGKAHSIEVFELKGKRLRHEQTIRSSFLISPNDLVALDEDRFYCTNDHGYSSKMGVLAENYLGLRASNVVYYNGSSFKVVADGIAYANGIAYDAINSQIYVASPRDFSIIEYAIDLNFNLQRTSIIDAGTGVDNIEFDQEGNLWVGCHPNLLRYNAYAQGKISKAPSEIIKVKREGKNKFQLSSVFLDDGSLMSGATVAIPVDKKLFAGNVMDKHFLLIEGLDFRNIYSEEKK